MRGVDEEVNRGEAWGHERSPPPIVVFGGEMKVTKQNRRLGARDDQNERDEQQKAEHVVNLVRPDRIQNEKELDEDAAKRQNATHDDARNGTRVKHLLGHVTRNRIRPH